MKNSRKFKHLKDFINGSGYKDIALQPLLIPTDLSYQFYCVFIVLVSLMYGNNNSRILHEFSALLDHLYIDNKINKLYINPYRIKVKMH